jgi:hypothetical protein
MFSFRTVVLPLALGLATLASAQAPTSGSSTSSSSSQTQADQNQPATNSVQARIRERKEKRRATAMHDAYSHLYDASLGLGYERFILSNGLQRVTEYAWDVAFTRYYSDRFGVMLDARGNDGTAFIEPSQNPQNNVFHPKIEQYTGMIGPSYRFYRTPRISVAGRVLAGVSYGKFSGDFAGNQIASTASGLYPDGATYAINAAVVGEYSLTPDIAIRLAPEYTATGFGSSIQNNRGFTAGLVYRFGKQ